MVPERRIIGAQRSAAAESEGAEVGEGGRTTWRFPVDSGHLRALQQTTDR